ncbi:MAG: hypothetical protein WA066_07600, partial [Candidatus Omnitrophota bacterium]
YNPEVEGETERVIEEIIKPEEKISAKPIPTAGKKFKFLNKEQESAFQKAKGHPTIPLSQKIKEVFIDLKNKATREYEHLPRTAEFAQLRFDLLRLAKQKGVASDKTARAIENITASLKHFDDFDVYRRKVILDDLAYTIEQGKEIPFGFTRETLTTEINRLNEIIQKRPQIKEALERRKKLWGALKSDYINAMDAIGFDVHEKMQNEVYFRHQVLEYVNIKSILGAGQKLKTPSTRGFLKKRKGSQLAINTDYLQAESEVMAQMLHDIEVARTIKKVQSNYDISSKVKAEARKEGLEDWHEAIPEGYTAWQPRQGNVFYMTDSIPAKLAEELYSGKLEELGITKDDLRKALAIGTKRKELVIKNEIAITLDNLALTSSANPISRASKALLRAWKVWSLISPRRFFKYNMRNLTGDADAAFVGNPSGFKMVPQAIKELYDVFISNKPMSSNMKDWFERGGMQSNLQFAEMGDVNELKIFGRFLDKEGNLKDIPAKAWNNYWKMARLATDLREAILRYANYLDGLTKMHGIPKEFGASMPEEILGLTDDRDRAFWFSNDLLGAYDRVSVIGTALREHIYPFWSWKEINFKRYIRFAKNAANNGKLSEAVGRKALGTLAKTPYTAYRVGKFLISAAAFWSALQVWNYTMFSDEEDELPLEEKSRPHIILGRTADGKIINFNRIGAFGDFLEWFGLDAAPQYVDSWFKNKMTLKEIAKDMAKSPLNTIIQGITPFAKTPAELLTRRSLFPDVTKPRTIRDRWMHIAWSLGLGDEYKAIAVLPSEPYHKSLSKFFVYESDPLQAAYGDIYEERNRFLEKIGKGAEGFMISRRGNALYNFKLAIRYKDKDAARKAIAEYGKLGGTKEGLAISLKNMHPLHGLTEQERGAFLQYLDSEGIKKLKKANRFYMEVLSGEEVKK